MRIPYYAMRACHGLLVGWCTEGELHFNDALGYIHGPEPPVLGFESVLGSSVLDCSAYSRNCETVVVSSGSSARYPETQMRTLLLFLCWLFRASLN